jgi:[ribosomal protein S5]-alanine N-acetyltransferase
MLTNLKIKLRKIEESDISQIAKLCHDKTIHDWVMTIPYPYTEADARFFYEKIVLKQELDNTTKHFAICKEQDETMIGTIALHFNVQKPFMAMIGYWIGAEYRNKGIMTTAVKEVIKIGFEEHNLKRIYATHKIGNKASAKVIINAGMEYEGILKSFVYYNGIFMDSPIYAIINDKI